MRSRSVATLGLLGALVLAGCAGTGAVAGDDPTPSVTAVPSTTATEQAHEAHDHDHDHGDVPLEISLEPSCVKPGDTMTVTVQTAPRVGVLYLAYYSDEQSGAKEPIGAGYGGNGGGYAEDDGGFQESWSVSDDAPTGPGYLKVVTVSGKQDDSTTFTVADPDSGSC